MENEQISVSTAKLILHEFDLDAHRKQRKHTLKDIHIAKRHAWAIETKRKLDLGVLKPQEMIFTDESKFTVQGSEGHAYYRKKRGAPLEKKHVKARIQGGGGSVFCYGAISYQGKSTIDFLDRGGRKNPDVRATGETIHQWEREHLKPSWDDWSRLLDDPMIVVHDNDRKAFTALNRNQRTGWGMEVLECPGNSPDMNIIEWVWGYIKQRLADRRSYPELPKDLDELQMRAITEWNATPRFLIRKWIDGFPNRVQALIDAKGGHTKH